MFPSIISRSISANTYLNNNTTEEVRKTRKLLIKTGSSVRKQQFAIDEVNKVNENINEKIQQLKDFTKKSKKTKKEITQKVSWLEGSQYLVNQEQHIQRDVISILESIMMSSLSINNIKTPQSSSSSQSSSSIPVNILIRECLDEYQHNLSERTRDYKLLMKRYQELKEMLNRTKGALQLLAPKQSSTQKQVQNQSEEEIESDKRRRTTATAVFADILRQVSQAHSLQGMDLAAKCSQYQREVEKEFIKICAMKSESKRSHNQSRIEEELEANPDIDTPEVYAILEEWREKIEAVDVELEETLANLNKEKEAIHFEYCLRAGCDENDPLGGWKELDHQILVKEVKRAQTKGIARNRLTETLITQLSHLTPEDISRHEDWYRCLKSIQERKKSEMNTSQLKREELLNNAKENLMAVRKKVMEENSFREERERHEQARMEVQKSLHLQRMVKMEELQSKLAEIEQQKLKALEDERKENERKMNEILQTKQLAEQFKQERQKYLESQREMERIRKEEEAQERKRQIELSKPKVEEREMLRLKKLEDMRRKEEILLAEELHRGELLNKLAEQVPYWDAIQSIESKLDHVTAAAEAQKYIQQEAETRGHLALNGFADAKLFKDAKFRLGLALREAGVHQSAAAAAVIAQLHPRQQAPW